MKTGTIGTILLAALCLSVGIWCGRWVEKPTIDELIARNNALAELDSVRTIELSATRSAYERITFEYSNASEMFKAVHDSMGSIISELAADIKGKNRQIEFLSSTNARLEYDLETALKKVSVSGDTVRASIEDKSEFQDGYINTEGEVVIDIKEQTGDATLSYDIGLTPTVALSRDASGVAQCTVSFGDMPIRATDIMCMNNIQPDLPTRREINLPQVGFGVGVGALVVLLLAAVL